MAAAIHDKINLRQLLQTWAPDTAGFLTANIRKKGRMKSKDLLGSVQSSSRVNPNGISTLEVSYLMYGKFVDMGVFGGKGMNEQGSTVDRLGGKKKKRLTKRQYQWYSKTMYGSMAWLEYKMMEHFGFEASAAVRLPSVIEL